MASVDYWNTHNALRKKKPTSARNKKRQLYLHSLVTKDRGLVLKLDLWNEGGSKGLFDIELFRAFTVVGMDISKVACRKAKKVHAWMNIINVTLTHLPFAANSFDVILDISTSDHLPFSLFWQCIHEYARLLKAQGELLLIFNNRLADAPAKTSPFGYWFFKEDVTRVVSKFFIVSLLRPYGSHPNELKHYLLKAIKHLENTHI